MPRDRDRLANALIAQQDRRGAPGAAVASAERLRDPRAVAVVTGQQAGLFGGPLYTLLKAVTAIQLAARTTRDFGVPAVPVFWIDAEDHDWDEVASTLSPDQDEDPLDLEEGWNRLLVAVDQGGGGWSLCARLAHPDAPTSTTTRDKATAKATDHRNANERAEIAIAAAPSRLTSSTARAATDAAAIAISSETKI